MATSNSHSDWWTPRDLVAVLKKEFDFDLDAAADANNTICSRYITIEMNALETPWDGKCVWNNPPYGQGYHNTIGPFVQRGYEQHLAQKNTVVMLLPAYTDPRYWTEYCMKAHEIRFLTGRLAFLDGGRKKMSARFPSCLVIWHYIEGTCLKAPHIWTWDWRH